MTQSRRRRATELHWLGKLGWRGVGWLSSGWTILVDTNHNGNEQWAFRKEPSPDSEHVCQVRLRPASRVQSVHVLLVFGEIKNKIKKCLLYQWKKVDQMSFLSAFICVLSVKKKKIDCITNWKISRSNFISHRSLVYYQYVCCIFFFKGAGGGSAQNSGT